MHLYEKLSNQGNKFFLFAGPCVIENQEMPYQITEKLIEITKKLDIDFVFKASYRKANRSKIDSFTGIGDKKALEILSDIRKKYSVPVITDIHTPQEADLVAQYVDILQIPAFLCRQTDLIVAASRTGKIINIKKGQFLSAENMSFAVQKAFDCGNKHVILCDRGTFFGYQDLIVDFRSIPIMKKNNVPVVMDITHCLQKPNQSSGVSGGDPKMIETIARAAISVGADGIFMETHPDPASAKSDGKNMLPLSDVEPLLENLVKLKHSISEIYGNN